MLFQSTDIPLSFTVKLEELQHLVNSSEDFIDQIIAAAATYSRLQDLLQYIYGLCLELRHRAILPTIISSDIEDIDAMLDCIVSDKHYKQRARLLGDTEQLVFMNELIKVFQVHLIFAPR